MFFGRTLNSLRYNEGELARIKAELDTVLRLRGQRMFEGVTKICRTDLVPLSGFIRSERWIVGVDLTYESGDGLVRTEHLVAKKQDRKNYEAELHGNAQLRGSGYDQHLGIVSLCAFDEDSLLTFARRVDGTDLRASLRRALLWGGRFQERTTDELKQAASWLARFQDDPSPTINVDEGIALKQLARYFNPGAKPEGVQGTVTPERVFESIKRNPQNDVPCLCHGDYGCPNILLSENTISVVDWERCHWGHPLEDCITGLASILTQGRMFPHRWRYVRRCLAEFAAEYAAAKQTFDDTLLVAAVIAAVEELFRWQRWQPHQRWKYTGTYYFPLLRKLQGDAYTVWANGGNGRDLIEILRL